MIEKDEVFYLNDEHRLIVEKHILNVKKLVYYATEDCGFGKFQEFSDILQTIYMYSNNFYTNMVEKKENDAYLAEFLFLIPNMAFYTAIGFLTALKNNNNKSIMRESLERIVLSCEDTTSELADVLIDENEKKELIKDLPNKEINQN